MGQPSPPADRPSYVNSLLLADEAEKAVREIVEEAASAPAGSEERKLSDLYASFMDAERAEQLGSKAVSEALVAARRVSSNPELPQALGLRERPGIRRLY